ncbi:MAG: Gfo/Idh/MocA family protein [Mangrovibacterium sp.]
MEHTSPGRRKFIGSTTAALAGITILPSHVIAGLGHRPPSDRLNIAGIGVGGTGYLNLKQMETENIVALCDVDSEYARRNSFREWDSIPQYADFRVLFEKQKDIDAVMIATPDHTHALPAMIAMSLGKHVYLETPLTHSIFESRILASTAVKYKVATQMGNQGNSGNGIRSICEWIWSGVIGEVTHVDVWTNRPTWPQKLQRPKKEMRIPKTLDWDLFIGPASYRPYHEIYHPWNWRAWWTFGSGALGDMGCHILDPVFKALNLKYPFAVQASSGQTNIESPPNSEIVIFEFPARDNFPKVAMPSVTVTWYDGGLMPPRPDELLDEEPMGDEDGGCIFYGAKGKIMCGAYAKNPTLLPTVEMDHFRQPEKSIRRISAAMDGGHEQDWIRACKETIDNRVESSSNFAYAGPLTEMVLLGVLAVRMQSLNRKLYWDSERMLFSNISNDDQLNLLLEDQFELVKGDPRINKKYSLRHAQQTVEEWIRHTYRQGWDQI